MRYVEIADKTDKKKVLQQQARKMHLYASIFLDISNILKILLPSDKALAVGQHIKSAMYAFIELKTGKRPDKF